MALQPGVRRLAQTVETAARTAPRRPE